MSVRQQVINSFDTKHLCTFSHEIPYRLTNFIDGMAWIGVLAGAAHKAGDTEVEELCKVWLTTVATVGEDARNYAPYQVKDEWLPSKSLSGYWFKEKPQSFAGPAAYHWAIKQGVDLPKDAVRDVEGTAGLLCSAAPVYGWLVKHFTFLRQHFNSFIFAHLLLGKTPPSSMEFSTQNNPFYAYLYGTTVDYTYSMHVSAWPAKHVWGAEEKNKTYTPVCQLASDYLQSTL